MYSLWNVCERSGKKTGACWAEHRFCGQKPSIKDIKRLTIATENSANFVHSKKRIIAN